MAASSVTSICAKTATASTVIPAGPVTQVSTPSPLPPRSRSPSTTSSIPAIVGAVTGTAATAVRPSGANCGSRGGSDSGSSASRIAATSPAVRSRSAAVRPASRCQTTSAG